MFLPTSSVVVALGHGSQTAMGHLIAIVVHAVIWSAVARFIWHAPLVLVAVLFILGCTYVLVQHARRES